MKEEMGRCRGFSLLNKCFQWVEEGGGVFSVKDNENFTSMVSDLNLRPLKVYRAP